MTTENRRKKRRREEPDFGASIFAGAVVCLAIYGGYKLFQREMHEQRTLGSGIDRDLLDRIVDQEVEV